MIESEDSRPPGIQNIDHDSPIENSWAVRLREIRAPFAMGPVYPNRISHPTAKIAASAMM